MGSILMLIKATLISALLATQASAAPAAPTVLERSGRWVARFDEDGCKILGAFGEGKDQISIQLRQLPSQPNFEISLFGEIFKTEDPFSDMKMAFAPHDGLIKVVTTNGDVNGIPTRISGNWRVDNFRSASPQNDVAPVTPAQEAAVEALDISSGKAVYRLHTATMAGTMRTLRNCMDELMTHWGYDPIQYRTLSHRAEPVGNIGKWVTSSDYPSGAISKGQMAIVHFRLDVDAVGGVGNCVVIAANYPPGLETLACRLIKLRAHFTPALDKDGKAVASFYVNTVRFTLPR